MKNKGIVKLIEKYQLNRTDEMHYRCRHRPTCSEYAKQSYERYNFFYASFLTTKRLLKCNRLFKPSYDPVPRKIERIEKDIYKIVKSINNKNNALDLYSNSGELSIYLSNIFTTVISVDNLENNIKELESKMYYIKNIESHKEDISTYLNNINNLDLIIFNLAFNNEINVNINDVIKSYEALNDGGKIIIASNKNDLNNYNNLIDFMKNYNYIVKDNYKDNLYLLTIIK